MRLDSGVTSEKVSGALAVTPSYPKHYPINFKGLNCRRDPSKTWSGSVWSNGSYQRPEGAGCGLGPGEARVGCRKSLNSLPVSLGESSISLKADAKMPSNARANWQQRPLWVALPTTGSDMVQESLAHPHSHSPACICSKLCKLRRRTLFSMFSQMTNTFFPASMKV